MSSKVLAALASAAFVTASVSSAFAACVTPQEQRADQIRAMQTQLMVGALKCGKYNGVDIRANYNSFVTRYSPQLVSHFEVLRGYFERTSSPSSYRAKMDSHVTELANAASLQSNAPDFCAQAAQLAKAAMTLTPDQIIDTGKAGPGLAVTLGKACRTDSQWVDDFTRAASGDRSSPEKAASNGTVGVRTISSSK
jgi:hypothetical protein